MRFNGNMEAGFIPHQGCGIEIFSQGEKERLHEGILRILERVGLGVHSDQALDIYSQGGCHVDKANKIVKFPRYVVEKSLMQIPSHFLMAGRIPEHDYYCGGRRVGFTPFGVGLLVEDLKGVGARESTINDFAEIFRVCDALDTIDVMLAVVQAVDMPEESQELAMTAAAFKNSSKHYAADAANAKTAETMIEMASIVAGGSKELRDRPILSFGVCPVTPLKLPGEAADVIIVAAKAGLPVEVLSMAMAGATSPVPLAGTIVVHMAEVIGALVLAQLVNPGCASYFGSSSTTFDMKSCAATVGAPEFALVNAGLAEMAQYYKVPITIGGL